MNAILTLYQADAAAALSQIAAAQALRIPTEPDYLDPGTVFSSWLGNQARNEDHVENLKRLAESGFRSSNWIDGFNLSGADLGGLDLSDLGLVQRVVFVRANLRASDLSGMGWHELDARHTDLREVVFDGTRLSDCDFRGAQLDGASLRGTRIEACTRWPEGFDPIAAGAVVERRDPGTQSRCQDGRLYRDGELIEEVAPR